MTESQIQPSITSKKNKLHGKEKQIKLLQNQTQWNSEWLTNIITCLKLKVTDMKMTKD